MDRLARLHLRPVAAAVAIALPSLVQAQLEEIFVTAERRATAELTTAISVEVFTAEQLALDKLQTVDDLQTSVPNFTVNNQGFNVQAVNIRGVGNAVINPNIQPGVVIMQDGMIMGETVVIDQAFLDVESIEILRGPQGTFVGQASTGGAVAINAARPSLDAVSGWVEARFGDYQDSKFSGALNLPLTDKLSTRFAFSQEERESFYENAFVGATGLPPYENGAHPGDTENQNVRASILWEPSDEFSVLARIELNSTRRGQTAPYQPNRKRYINPNDPTGFGQSQYASFVDSNPDPYSLSYDAFPNFDSISNRYSLEVSKYFDSGLQFISRTGYQYNDLRSVAEDDFTGVNAEIDRVEVGPDNDYWTQEFNLISPGEGRLSWLVGTAWYYRYTPVHLNNDDNSCGYVPTTGVVRPCPTAPQLPGLVTLGLIQTIQRHAGLFGQVLFDISDTWELELGVRNSWDNNIDTTDIHVGILGPPPTPCATAEATRGLPADNRYLCINPVPKVKSKFKEEEPTYKVGLNWTPSDGQFVYMFYTKGYKSGGVNSGLRFENEIVEDYEFGYKSTLLDGRMQIQTGIFSMDYQNMQQQAFLVNHPNGFAVNNAIINIGDSTIEGLELELNSRFGNLGFNFGLGYVSSDLGSLKTVDVRFLDPILNIAQANYVPNCAPGQVPIPNAFGPGRPSCFDYLNSPAAVSLSSSDNLYSPELEWNLSLDYTFETRSGAAIRPRIALSHSDSAFAALFQSDDFFRIDGRDNVNFSVSYENDTWSTSVFCNNCTDETNVVTVTTGNSSEILYNAPRTVGVRFRYDF
jgi:iron complex outermembrane receptor protein